MSAHARRITGTVSMDDGTIFDFRITVDNDGRIATNSYTLAGLSADAVNYRLEVAALLNPLLVDEFLDTDVQ